jgi:hypothetical protein
MLVARSGSLDRATTRQGNCPIACECRKTAAPLVRPGCGEERGRRDSSGRDLHSRRDGGVVVRACSVGGSLIVIPRGSASGEGAAVFGGGHLAGLAGPSAERSGAEAEFVGDCFNCTFVLLGWDTAAMAHRVVALVVARIPAATPGVAGRSSAVAP